MKKLLLKMSLSADGFCADAKGGLDWIFSTQSKDAIDWGVASVSNVSLHLMGRRTFRDMAAWWPTSRESFAAPMNNIPKAVFSRRGFDPTANRQLITMGLKSARAANRHQQGAKASAAVIDSWLHPQVHTGDLAAAIRRLKRGRGKPLVAYGGASFARSLIRTGLIDEYWLLIHPVVLGRGLPIFTEIPRRMNLTLVDCKRFKSGAIANVYRAKD